MCQGGMLLHTFICLLPTACISNHQPDQQLSEEIKIGSSISTLGFTPLE
jgi:hypothetical protein